MTSTSSQETERQREITRLCVQVAQLLLQHGAESAIVVQMAHRLGLALGVDSVECALTPNAIILTTLAQDHCITTVRKNQDKGINMQVVTEVQRIVITAERKIYDMQQVHAKLARIKPLKYNRYFVMLMIGVSCASFAHLSGGDALVSLVTFLAAALAMYVRQSLVARHYNPLIVFAVTAFVASLIAGIALKYNIGNQPKIALASSVLLLVPGFPLINALADILKGHINMGIARWALATILTFGACLGIVFALSLFLEEICMLNKFIQDEFLRLDQRYAAWYQSEETDEVARMGIQESERILKILYALKYNEDPMQNGLGYIAFMASKGQ